MYSNTVLKIGINSWRFHKTVSKVYNYTVLKQQISDSKLSFGLSVENVHLCSFRAQYLTVKTVSVQVIKMYNYTVSKQELYDSKTVLNQSVSKCINIQFQGTTTWQKNSFKTHLKFQLI